MQIYSKINKINKINQLNFQFCQLADKRKQIYALYFNLREKVYSVVDFPMNNFIFSFIYCRYT